MKLFALFALFLSTAAQAEFFFQCKLSRGDAWAQSLAPSEIRFEEAGDWFVYARDARGRLEEIMSIEVKDRRGQSAFISADGDHYTFKFPRTKQVQGRVFEGRETLVFQPCANEQDSTATYEFRSQGRTLTRAAYVCQCGID
ncbi:MAG TPA: hypothetical protein VM598_05670 [Bdellovibrionota bacterium]|nr:hypothetical protein [Bdellovibrionota bacterium]